MSENESKVAWGGAIRESGNLDAGIRNDLRGILNELGIALETEAKNSGISIYSIPIFREFNLFCGLAQNYFAYVVSPSVGGFPLEIWIDWRNLTKDYTIEEIEGAIQQRFGWTATSILYFPKNILKANSDERRTIIKDVARKWISDLTMQKEKIERIVRVNPIFKGRDFLLEKDLCFVLIPFKEPFLRLYADVLKPTLTNYFSTIMKANDIFSPTPIMEDIWGYINKSALIVADVTGKNPNVFYELGIAHTVGKTVIIITQDENNIPFDLKHIRYLKYTDNAIGWQSLKEELINFVESTLSKNER